MDADPFVWATKQMGWWSPSSDCDGVHLRMNCPCDAPFCRFMLWGPLINSSETLQHHQRREQGPEVLNNIFSPLESLWDTKEHRLIHYTSFNMSDVQKPFRSVVFEYFCAKNPQTPIWKCFVRGICGRNNIIQYFSKHKRSRCTVQACIYLLFLIVVWQIWKVWELLI